MLSKAKINQLEEKVKAIDECTNVNIIFYAEYEEEGKVKALNTATGEEKMYTFEEWENRNNSNC
jgi:hypothetical protein